MAKVWSQCYVRVRLWGAQTGAVTVFTLPIFTQSNSLEKKKEEQAQGGPHNSIAVFKERLRKGRRLSLHKEPHEEDKG